VSLLEYFARGLLPPVAGDLDLLAESERRTAAGREAARAELGPSTTVAGPWFEIGTTLHLPDPYGPDPVVFGYAPRVRGPYSH
jgi:hypothetical protein